MFLETPPLLTCKFLSRDGMPPADLLAEGRAEVTGYGVELISDQVLGMGAPACPVSEVPVTWPNRVRR